MNLLLRRKGTGLETLRLLHQKMQSTTMIRNDRTTLPRGGENKYCFTWGYVRALPNGFTVLNPPNAVAISTNKARFRRKLWENGLTMPTTTDMIDAVSMVSSNPNNTYLIRPNSHFGGNNMVIIRPNMSLDEKIAIIRREFGRGERYMSLYIDKCAEYRVFFTQGRVVYVSRKVVDDHSEIAWNVHQGGHFENVGFRQWHPKVLAFAYKAMKLTNLDYGAVDVMTKNDETYVLEINTAPQLTAEYWSTCVAKAFDYMVQNGNESIAIGEREGVSVYRKYIHPAISDKAIYSGSVNLISKKRVGTCIYTGSLYLYDTLVNEDTGEEVETVGKELLIKKHQNGNFKVFSKAGIDLEVLYETVKQNFTEMAQGTSNETQSLF